MDSERGGRRRLAALAALFFLSGMASLIDEVVWLRYLSLTFGNTTYATATLLAVFMGGLGFGALLFGRLADRLRRPLVAYAILESGVALFALATPRFFALIDQAYIWLYRSWGSQPELFAGGRVVLAALCLLPPTLLMGGTLPLILRAATLDEREVGRRSALFYALNTLGAVAGVALAGFFTIRLVGLWASLLLAAAGSLMVALGALLLSRPVPLPKKREEILPAPRLRWLLALFFAMGATSLAYEVLWTRILVFYLGSSVYAYSLMLALFLLGVGAGSLCASPWADRLRSPLAALALLEGGIAATALLGVPLFIGLNDRLGTLSEWIQPRTFPAGTWVQLLAILPILAPPTLLMGASFPVAVRALHRGLERLGREVGTVYGANTLGSIAGSLAAGFLLIPLLGTQNSLVAVASANALLAAAVWIARPADHAAQHWRRIWVVVAPAACLAAIPILPPNEAILAAGIFRHDRPQDLVYFREDASASVTIRRRHDAAEPYLSLELNGVNVAGTSPDLYAIQKMQGHLPLLLADNVRRVVHIGFGSGGTAHAVSLHPVEEIRVIEISPEVLSASDTFFGDINHGVLDDPRMATEVNDGRNFLLATDRTFDAILSDSIHPRFAGNGSLYTRDYFELIRAHLAPGGVTSMWLPTYSLTTRNYAMIVRAFQEVFPNTAIWYEPSALNAFTIVTGKLDPEPWDPAAIASALTDRRLSLSLADLGIQDAADLLACYLAGGDELTGWLRRVPPHTDDIPAVEYESGALLERDWTWLATFSELLALRPEAPPAAYLQGLSKEERGRAAVLWEERGRLLADQRRFLAEKLTSHSLPVPN